MNLSHLKNVKDHGTHYSAVTARGPVLFAKGRIDGPTAAALSAMCTPSSVIRAETGSSGAVSDAGGPMSSFAPTAALDNPAGAPTWMPYSAPPAPPSSAYGPPIPPQPLASAPIQTAAAKPVAVTTPAPTPPAQPKGGKLGKFAVDGLKDISKAFDDKGGGAPPALAPLPGMMPPLQSVPIRPILLAADGDVTPPVSNADAAVDRSMQRSQDASMDAMRRPSDQGLANHETRAIRETQMLRSHAAGAPLQAFADGGKTQTKTPNLSHLSDVRDMGTHYSAKHAVHGPVVYAKSRITDPAYAAEMQRMCSGGVTRAWGGTDAKGNAQSDTQPATPSPAQQPQAAAPATPGPLDFDLGVGAQTPATPAAVPIPTPGTTHADATTRAVTDIISTTLAHDQRAQAQSMTGTPAQQAQAAAASFKGQSPAQLRATMITGAPPDSAAPSLRTPSLSGVSPQDARALPFQDARLPSSMENTARSQAAGPPAPQAQGKHLDSETDAGAQARINAMTPSPNTPLSLAEMRGEGRREFTPEQVEEERKKAEKEMADKDARETAEAMGKATAGTAGVLGAASAPKAPPSPADFSMSPGGFYLPNALQSKPNADALGVAAANAAATVGDPVALKKPNWQAPFAVRDENEPEAPASDDAFVKWGLTPEASAKAQELNAKIGSMPEAREAGLSVDMLSGHRTFAEQKALSDKYKADIAAGGARAQNAIFAPDPGPDEAHQTNPDSHMRQVGWDLQFHDRNGNPVSRGSVPDKVWAAAAKIARGLGITPGYGFGNKDQNHFQLGDSPQSAGSPSAPAGPTLGPSTVPTEHEDFAKEAAANTENAQWMAANAANVALRHGAETAKIEGDQATALQSKIDEQNKMAADFEKRQGPVNDALQGRIIDMPTPEQAQRGLKAGDRDPRTADGIDPNHWMNSRDIFGSPTGTGRKVLSVIAQMLGAFGAGFGTPNFASQMIAKYVDEDIDSQKARLKQMADQQKISRDQYQDQVARLEWNRGVQKDQYGHILASTVAKQGGEDAYAKSLIEQARLGAEGLSDRMKVIKNGQDIRYRPGEEQRAADLAASTIRKNDAEIEAFRLKQAADAAQKAQDAGLRERANRLGNAIGALPNDPDVAKLLPEDREAYLGLLSANKLQENRVDGPIEVENPDGKVVSGWIPGYVRQKDQQAKVSEEIGQLNRVKAESALLRRALDTLGPRLETTNPTLKGQIQQAQQYLSVEAPKILGDVQRYSEGLARDWQSVYGQPSSWWSRTTGETDAAIAATDRLVAAKGEEISHKLIGGPSLNPLFRKITQRQAHARNVLPAGPGAR